MTDEREARRPSRPRSATTTTSRVRRRPTPTRRDPRRPPPTDGPPLTPVEPGAPRRRPARARGRLGVRRRWPASPVVPPAAPPRRGGRVRWAVGLAIVALVIGTSAAVAAIITGRSSTGSTSSATSRPTRRCTRRSGSTCPATSARPPARSFEVPGLRGPGRARHQARRGRSTSWSGSATDNEQTYTGDIKPWFDGELAYSVGTAAARRGRSRIRPSRSATSVPWPWSRSRIRPARRRGSTPQLTKAGATSTTEAYQGDTIHLFQRAEGIQPAYAIVDGKVIADRRRVASVKAAIDTKGSGGFADEPGPKAALGSVSGDHVGFAYMALRPLLAWSEQLSESMGAGAGAAAAPAVTAADAQGDPRVGRRTGSGSRTTPSSWRRPLPKPETAVGPTENRVVQDRRAHPVDGRRRGNHQRPRART